MKNTMGAPWTEMYSMMKEYHKKHGHCVVPSVSKNDPLKKLHTWVIRMRYLKRIDSTALTPEKIRLLNNIGFIWDLRLETLFAPALTATSMQSLNQIEKAIKDLMKKHNTEENNAKI
tara:strand:- start:23 stop:373 length:351 start_codon:yes stop_codon:yes gene_type:complete